VANGFIGDWGEGCEAVGGSSDMIGPRLDGSSFGGGVNLDGRGTNGGNNPHSDMTIPPYPEIVTNLGNVSKFSNQCS